MRPQYAALNDLESVINEITKLGKGRLVLYYDASTGWVATDEVEVVPSKDGPGVVEFKIKAYKDWFRPNVANAVSALGAVRFLGASAMDKLFRKPLPVDPLPSAQGGEGKLEKAEKVPAVKTAVKAVEPKNAVSTAASAKK